MSASTALAAAPACVGDQTRPSSAAVRRNAARSICRSPGKRVLRVDGVAGTHRCGSRQFHTTPCTHRCSSSCPNTRVGTSGTSTCSLRARARNASTATSACRIHPST
eukprot:1979877-Pleurochrysis_carterae.AAC.1